MVVPSKLSLARVLRFHQLAYISAGNNLDGRTYQMVTRWSGATYMPSPSPTPNTS